MIAKINPHVSIIKESPTLFINQMVKQLREQRREIYHFGFGESPFSVPPQLVRALQEHAEEKTYQPTQGMPRLCDAIAQFHQQEFDYPYTANEVFVGPGSKELIFQLIYLLEGPLLLPIPSWVSYGPMAQLRDKELIPIPTSRNFGYRVQPEELEQICQQCDSKQKLLILNNPGNPTGSVYGKKEIEGLAEVCERHNVLVISDEIYALLNFSGHPYYSLATHIPNQTIVTGGLSKAFSAGGWRLGFAMIPKNLSTIHKVLQAMISETFSAVSSPVQAAAITAYAKYDTLRPLIERYTEIHKYTGEYLHQRFLSMGLNCPKPEGAFYLFPDFENFREGLAKQGILTGKKLAEILLIKHNVAMLPAANFYFPESHFGMRVASVDYNGPVVLEAFPGKKNMTKEMRLELFPNLVKGCDSLEEFLKTL